MGLGLLADVEGRGAKPGEEQSQEMTATANSLLFFSQATESADPPPGKILENLTCGLNHRRSL